MITLDSLDDDLIEKRHKEIKTLEQENKNLKEEYENVNKELSTIKDKVFSLELENSELKQKLLVYEHDPIIFECVGNVFLIKVWSSETDNYEIFAKFYDIGFETDLEEFCKEFVLELKDAYMVE